MKHAHVSVGHEVDARLVAISKRFDRHAAEADRLYSTSSTSPFEGCVEEICLDAVQTALIVAATGIRHQTQVGRTAKERMLAHIERWAGKDSVPYSEDRSSLGGRLALSLL